MEIKKIIISADHSKKDKDQDCPTKEEIIKAVKRDMVHIGVSKSLWVEGLELPEEDFDAVLAKAADDAEHVAKGDEKGLKLALEYADASMKGLLEVLEGLEDDEDDDDADDNEED